MWRRLLGHCQTLAGDDATWRRPAAAALGDDAFLDGACCQAVLDGATADEALSTCYDLLATEVGEELHPEERKAIRRRIAKARLGILVWRAGTGAAPRAAMVEGLSRLLGDTPPRTRPDADATVAGWDWFAECCKDFPSAPAYQLLNVRQEVEELVRKAHYDTIRPALPEEHTLLGVLRGLPLFPPLRFDEIPEDGGVPDDYAPASRLFSPDVKPREQHLGPVMGLLGCGVPRVRLVAALLFEMLTPVAVQPWQRSKTPDVTEEERRLTLQMTDDPLPVLRRLAVKRLGTLYHGFADPEAVAAIVPHLRDPSAAVRVAAARSVAKLIPGDAVSAILDGLLPMLHEDAEPSLAAALEAAVALGSSLTERHIDRIEAVLPHPSARVALNAARATEAAAARAARPQIAEALLDLFGRPEPEVRAAAVLAYGALGMAPNDRGLDELGRVLNSEAIRERGREMLLPSLVGLESRLDGSLAFLESAFPNILLSDPDVGVAAITAVRRLGPLVATHTILTGLVRLLREGHVEATLAALEAIGPAAMRDDVFDALGDKFGSASGNRARAIFHTGRRLGPAGFGRMLGVVAERLGDPDAGVRRLAVLVLGELKAEAATPEFLAKVPPLLHHPLAGVRESAALALEFIGPAAATEVIVQRLAQLKYDPDRDVRFRAEDALYRLTGRR